MRARKTCEPIRIWKQELIALQTLYSRFAKKSPNETISGGREERLAWASENVGHKVSSFIELTHGEAQQLIELLRKNLGDQRPRTRSREWAMARGVAGRKGHFEPVAILASREDLAEIDRMRLQAGMSQEQFNNWLRSRKSPTHGRVALTTVSDVNRVRWGLKSLLKRRGEQLHDPRKSGRADGGGSGTAIDQAQCNTDIPPFTEAKA